ncbi:MAG TPA: 50S ribosome-binding GTPase, partial [Candidatus Wallbacteria bacterium]|nr:50S ribosome-binding GTPase [Candidatus Wallbacteria bacterium]
MSKEMAIFYDSEKLKQAYENNAETANEKVEQELKNKLVISLYGPVNAGKSTLINALFGKKLSEVSPIPGFTKEINIFNFNNDVLIADTPGIRDINESIAAKAEEFIQNDADLILFFIPSIPGLDEPILMSFKKIVKLKKELLSLLSMIDIKDEDEIPLLEKHTLDQLSKHKIDIKLISISGKKNINIDILQKEIMSILDEKGKSILFAKANKDKWPAVQHYILRACGKIAGLTVWGNELDLDRVTEIQLELVKKIACVYNVSVRPADLIHFITDLCSRDITFKLYTESHKILTPYIKQIPFIEKGLSIALPAAVTYGIGSAANAYYASGMKKTADELDQIFREHIMEYGQKDIEDFKNWIKGKV